MTESQLRFAGRLVRRKKLFLLLSVAGLAVAAAVAVHATLRTIAAPGESASLRWVIVLLILLNSRQNLRQFRVAALLERMGWTGPGPEAESSKVSA